MVTSGGDLCSASKQRATLQGGITLTVIMVAVVWLGHHTLGGRHGSA